MKNIFMAVMAVFLLIATFLPLNENEALASSAGKDTFVVIIDMKASKSQKLIADFLSKNKGEILNSFWLNNSILARVDSKTLFELRSFGEVDAIYPNFEVKIPKIQERAKTSAEQVQALTTWGIDRIDAPEVWATGVKGAGIREMQGFQEKV